MSDLNEDERKELKDAAANGRLLLTRADLRRIWESVKEEVGHLEIEQEESRVKSK